MSKREFLKRSGTAVTGVSMASIGAQSAAGARGRDPGNETNSGGSSSDGDEITTQWASNVDLSVDDYDINLGDDGTLSASWEVDTPSMYVKHSFVVLVEAKNVFQPRVGASDFSPGDVKTNFEYVDSSNLPVDYDAYKFKAVKQFLQGPGADVDVELDAVFESNSYGRVEIQAGFPRDQHQPLGSMWAGARVEIE